MRRTTMRLLVIAMLIQQLGGCGYLIFPERAGQPQGRVDWGVVGLNAVGLVFGVVPGVIAFAVDFATGCIYLPSPPYADTGNPAAPPGAATTELPSGWRTVVLFEPQQPGALGTALATQLGPEVDPAALERAIHWQPLAGVVPTMR